MATETIPQSQPLTADQVPNNAGMVLFILNKTFFLNPCSYIYFRRICLGC